MALPYVRKASKEQCEFDEGSVVKKPIPFGKYYLLERINVGGMAEVFRAKAYGVEGFERLVAVKRILPNIAEDKEFIKMFVDEAKLAVQLTHANIAQIFDLGMVGSDYYIALEHIHGRDLRNIFERCRSANEPMPIAQACFVTMKICEGLDYAHNKRDAGGRDLNLVHRDVSPQNILISFEGEAKLIDFGIAKAAGKGSQTEAGILKGKFGYMSPEQVRGLPIDRRSDVFSCGIVLYELLTGERLFVGESDFSTLEKVRNVEILPPSTYNRRISDELERIVLKALAKDVEDRYQNAIDLHDELQAFVYTAGEFYSRKDLAGWMKKSFAKEIEQETAKLEAYRKVSPPEARAPKARTARSSTMPPPTPRRTTTTMPPPIPNSGGMPARPNPAVVSPPAMSAKSSAGKGLDWDDDELETSIYEGASSDAPIPPMAAAGMATSENTTNDERRGKNQDLSTLVQKAKGWNGADEAAPIEPPKKTPTGSNKTPNPLVKVDAPAQKAEENIATVKDQPRPSDALPVETAPPALAIVPSGPQTLQPAAAPAARRSTAMVAAAAPPMALPHAKRSTYEGPTVDLLDRPVGSGESKTGLIAAIIAGILLLVGGIVAVVMLLGNDEAKPAVAENVVLEKTGFALYLSPKGAEVWLDGEFHTKNSAKITSLQPGVEYELKIKPPPGYKGVTRTLVPVANEVQRIEINLESLGIKTAFASVPPGASVTLLSEGKAEDLGATPFTKDLVPGVKYRAIFQSGEMTKTENIEIQAGAKPTTVTATFSGAAASTEEAPVPEEKPEPAKVEETKPEPPKTERKPTAAELAAKERRRERRDRERQERAEAAAAAAAKKEAARIAAEKKRAAEKAAAEKKKASVEKPAVAETGVLLLGSKPPCAIYIDGKNTGLKTPQRQIKLSAGKHKVVLVNNEHGIRDSFTVRIKAGKRTKAIRDHSDKIQ